MKQATRLQIEQQRPGQFGKRTRKAPELEVHQATLIQRAVMQRLPLADRVVVATRISKAVAQVVRSDPNMVYRVYRHVLDVIHVPYEYGYDNIYEVLMAVNDDRMRRISRAPALPYI